MTIVVTSFSSCKDDDDPAPTSGIEMLVGTWSTQDNSITIVFNANGTGSEQRGSGVPMNFSFTTSVQSNVTVIRIEYAGQSSATEWEVSRTGNIMDLSRGNEYLRLYKK